MSNNAHGEAAVGQTVEWYTPPEIFAALGLQFDLDPASPGADIVPWIPATQHFTPTDNGLWYPWRGRVWLNPPYGPTAPDFLARLVDHGDGVALVYTRTESGWWQATAPRASAVCFMRDRVSFVRHDGYQARSPMGSALLAFGDTCANAVVRADLGWTVT